MYEDNYSDNNPEDYWDEQEPVEGDWGDVMYQIGVFLAIIATLYMLATAKDNLAGTMAVLGIIWFTFWLLGRQRKQRKLEDYEESPAHEAPLTAPRQDVADNGEDNYKLSEYEDKIWDSLIVQLGEDTVPQKRMKRRKREE